MLRSVGRRLVPLLSSTSCLSSTARPCQSQQWCQPVTNDLRHRALFSSEPSKEKTLPASTIATGLELEELKAELEGRKLFDLDPPRGPFGTKESPAMIDSYLDERIVGCCGGENEDEHDVVWFNLKKGETYECTVCSQVFQLRVIGAGGPPGGHHHH
eukprot:c15312_g1_i1 orf=319-789(+)